MKVFENENPQGTVLGQPSWVGVKNQQLLELTLESIVLSAVSLLWLA